MTPGAARLAVPRSRAFRVPAVGAMPEALSGKRCALLRVTVVGSGPSGVHTAEALLKPVARVYEDVAAQLVLRAAGYRGVELPGLPFDPVRGTVPHAAGRVPSPGEYVAGWIKRGRPG